MGDGGAEPDGSAVDPDRETSAASAAAVPAEAVEPEDLSAEQVTEIARAVIGRLAPHELVVFPAAADAWLAAQDPHRRRKGTPGTSVGFGTEAVLLSELVFPVVAGTLADVLGSGVTERMRRRRRARVASAPVLPARDGDPASAGHGGAGGMKLADQRARLRDTCQRHAIAAGLSADKAALLADAFIGALGSQGLL